jgi:hypothetical protein
MYPASWLRTISGLIHDDAHVPVLLIPTVMKDLGYATGFQATSFDCVFVVPILLRTFFERYAAAR